MFPIVHATCEPFANAHKANMEAFKALADAALAGGERRAALNLDAARGMLEDGIGNARILLDGTALKDPMGMQSRLARPVHEQIAAYSGAYREIASEAQKEMSTIMSSWIAEGNTTVTSAMEETTSAPGTAAKPRKTT